MSTLSDLQQLNQLHQKNIAIHKIGRTLTFTFSFNTTRKLQQPVTVLTFCLELVVLEMELKSSGALNSILKLQREHRAVMATSRSYESVLFYLFFSKCIVMTLILIASIKAAGSHNHYDMQL